MSVFRCSFKPQEGHRRHKFEGMHSDTDTDHLLLDVQSLTQHMLYCSYKEAYLLSINKLTVRVCTPMGTRHEEVVTSYNFIIKILPAIVVALPSSTDFPFSLHKMVSGDRREVCNLSDTMEELQGALGLSTHLRFC